MIFGFVSSDMHAMPSHIFEESLKVKQSMYQNALETLIKPWIG